MAGGRAKAAAEMQWDESSLLLWCCCCSAVANRYQKQDNDLKLNQRRHTSQRREIGSESKLMRMGVRGPGQASLLIPGPDQTLAVLDSGRAPPAGQLEMKDGGWIRRVEARMRSSTELAKGKGSPEGDHESSSSSSCCCCCFGQQ